MGNCSSDLVDDSEPRAISAEAIQAISSKGLTPVLRCQEFPVSGRRLNDDYEVEGTVLGEGLCGNVVLMRRKIDQGKFAMKTIDKMDAGSGSSSSLELPAEVEIYLALDHPNIAQLHGVYQTSSKVTLIMECCEGGELYSRLQKRGVYPEADAAEASRQMLRAVGFLHLLSIVHRDLKLENFLYDREDSKAQLRLIDFGFAHVWDRSTLMKAPCGSISYVSPDVLSGTGYTDKCDLWSIGVIVWMLLCGYPPFHGKQEKAVLAKIKAGKPDWSHRRRWKPVSDEAVAFVKRRQAAGVPTGQRVHPHKPLAVHRI